MRTARAHVRLLRCIDAIACRIYSPGYGTPASAASHAHGSDGIECTSDMIRFAHLLPRVLLDAADPLGFYARSCLSDMHAWSAPHSSALAAWPCPPPYSWHVTTPSNAKHRYRHAAIHTAIRLWTNAAVMCLSFLHGGRSRVCPYFARSGIELNRVQRAACGTIESLIARMIRAPHGCGGLARIRSSNLCTLVSAACSTDIGSQLGSVTAASDNLPSVADRTCLMKSEACAKVDSFLSMFEAAALYEPRFIRKNSEDVREKVGVFSHNLKAEILRFIEHCDQFQRVELLPGAALPMSTRTPLIATTKDACQDL